jgi:hypothetical protein
MNNPLYLYIHGFNSSPSSYKARAFVDYLRQRGEGERVLVPALSHRPVEAIALLEQLIEFHAERDILLLGSSLGGYYATYLMEKLGRVDECTMRAVMINPAVRPYELLEGWLGEQENLYTAEPYRLTLEHLQQLLALDCDRIAMPKRYLLLTQTDDETLDYRQAVEKFCDSPAIIQQGGSHGFDDFESMIPTILAFGRGERLTELNEQV